MKAVIMAGGAGTRLRPLTCKTPKPMVEIAGEPAICHIIRLLKQNGIENAAVTTMYLAEKITALGDEFDGVKLRYYNEKTPLGTAGSVLNTADFLDDDFIVISGDGICDFDLKSAMDFHKKKKADCTIVLTTHKKPLEYGVVICDGNNKITRFIEKPAWSQTFSDCINTGIYIMKPSLLSLIPPGKSYDFGKDFFPKLLGGKLYGYVSKGYWCDIGSIRDWYKCNFDAINGVIMGIKKRPLTFDKSIVGEDCKILCNDISTSIIESNVIIGKNSRLDECIICSGAKIGDNVKIESGAVIGNDCIIGDNVTIHKNIKIYSDKIIKKGSDIIRDIVFEKDQGELFCDSGICGSFAGTLSPDKCFCIGSASVIKENARVGVMINSDGGEGGDIVKNSLLSGIAWSGGKGLDFGIGNRLLSSFACISYSPDIMLFAEYSPKDDALCIYPSGNDSLTLTSEAERKIRNGFEKGTCERGKVTSTVTRIDGIKELYINTLLRNKDSLSGLSCLISDSGAGELLGSAINLLGGKARLCENRESFKGQYSGSLYFDIDDEKADLYIGGEYTADFDHIRALLIKYEAKFFGNIALPYLSPSILEKIAKDEGSKVYKYLTTPTGGGDSTARVVACNTNQLIFRDTCFACLEICKIFATVGFEYEKIKEIFKSLPDFSQYNRDVEFDDEKKAAIMKKFSGNSSPETEGVEILFDNGRAFLVPRKTGGFRIISEAANAEAAKEITFETERKLYGKEEKKSQK